MSNISWWSDTVYIVLAGIYQKRQETVCPSDGIISGLWKIFVPLFIYFCFITHLWNVHSLQKNDKQKTVMNTRECFSNSIIPSAFINCHSNIKKDCSFLLFYLFIYAIVHLFLLVWTQFHWIHCSHFLFSYPYHPRIRQQELLQADSWHTPLSFKHGPIILWIYPYFRS